MTPDREGGAAVDVRSPASGLVSQILQESARTPVAVGAPLVEVADTSGLEAAIEFSSQDAVRIREGMAAESRLGVAMAPWRRSFVVKPRASRRSRRWAWKNSGRSYCSSSPAIPHGGRGSAPAIGCGEAVLRREPQALKAPLGALVRDRRPMGCIPHCRRASASDASPGRRARSSEAEIRGGLGRSDRVIVFPSDRVVDGARVRVRPVGGLIGLGSGS